jgi:hypothetical protein
MEQPSFHGADCCEELSEHDLSDQLRQILEYVGPGHFQFLALVAKAWHAKVRDLPSVNRRSRRSRTTFTVLNRMTTCDAVFASTSRLLWALDTGFKCTDMWAMYAAGLYASIDTLTEIAEQLEPYIVFQAIIDDSRIDVFKWGLNYWSTIGNNPDLCYQFILATAADEGNLLALKLFAAKHKLCVSAKLLCRAVTNSHWHVVEYLKAQAPDVEWEHTDRVEWLYWEALDQRVDIVQFIQEQNHAKDAVEAVYHASLQSGDISTVRSLQPLFNEHFEITDAELDEAVGGGYLSMCLYLVEHSSSAIVRESVPHKAALRGHTDILRWSVDLLVRDHRDFDASMVILAVACTTGCVDTLQFLYPHLPAEGNTAGFTHGLSYAAVRGFLEAAKWFKEKGGSWPSTLGDESANWPKHLVEWARSENCTAPLHIT